MQFTRRDFLRIAGASAAAVGLTSLGIRFSANTLKGSAHFSSRIWLCWLRCLIHMRVDKTPGNSGERSQARNSPRTVGMGCSSPSIRALMLSMYPGNVE